MNSIRKKRYLIYLYRIISNYINILIIGFINIIGALVLFNPSSEFTLKSLWFFIYVLIFFIFKLIIKRFKNVFVFIIVAIASTIYFFISFSGILLFYKGN